MPEGDTLYRVARWLHAELAGRELDALWLKDRGALPALAGASVTEAQSIGKHVLIGIVPHPKAGGDGAARSGPAVLHFHLGMYGKVRRFDSEAGARRPSELASLALERGATRWIVFRAMTAELIHRRALADHPVLSRLGPDLLAPRVDLARVVDRARRVHHTAIADLLIDQTVAAGIGNRFKCEALFAERVHPLRAPERLTDGELLALYRRARELLAESVSRAARDAHLPTPRDAPAPREWVYGREGKPCPSCGTAIRVERMGDGARGVWYCPRCQAD